MESETYIFSGGGSGGHLFPGIAVADELRRRQPTARILFVGSDRPVETSILQTTGYSHRPLPVASLRELRRAPLSFLRRNWSAWREARGILKTERPCWVIGLGGFVSAPAVWSARQMRIPVLLLEQNVLPGAATRWLSGCARHVCLSFAETHDKLRSGLPAVITGNPIRREIVAAANRRRYHTKPDDHSRKTLLILGGSQGAESLNQALMLLAPEIAAALSGWRVAHQTGPGRSAAIRARWQALDIPANIEDFFPDMADRYFDADLVISRAGATTLVELACLGCPSILVPYPFAADNHQAANAEIFSRHGASLAVSQAATASETADRLRDPLLSLLSDSRRRADMSDAARRLALPDAASDIVDLLLHEKMASRLICETASKSTPAPHLVRSQELVP